MKIRKSELSDIPFIMSVLEEAREVMRENGNMNQWINGYPQESVIRDDIARGHSFVMEEDDVIKGTFAYIIGKDPTYAVIEDGQWVDDESPYGTVHRIGGARGSHGIAHACIEWCLSRCPNLRIDTHSDNGIMRHILQREGFGYCGIIHVADGSPRLAYQRQNIRPARADDARFIAENVFRALLIDNPSDSQMDVLESICRREDTLYSWRNTMIAMRDGRRAGILVSYDGARYRSMRDITFPIFLGDEDFSGMDDECRAGEMYCDSLAVEPEFQHNGIGRSMLEEFLRRSAASGLTAAIAVEPGNSKARSLYESLGFSYDGEVFLFGHNYLRMAVR